MNMPNDMVKFAVSTWTCGSSSIDSASARPTTANLLAE